MYVDLLDHPLMRFSRSICEWFLCTLGRDLSFAFPREETISPVQHTCSTLAQHIGSTVNVTSTRNNSISWCSHRLHIYPLILDSATFTYVADRPRIVQPDPCVEPSLGDEKAREPYLRHGSTSGPSPMVIISARVYKDLSG